MCQELPGHFPIQFLQSWELGTALPLFTVGKLRLGRLMDWSSVSELSGGRILTSPDSWVHAPRCPMAAPFHVWPQDRSSVQ